MKVASFHVRASMSQSIRWKQASEGEGFPSVGSWAARALDAYLEGRMRAGRPIPLAWHRGAFCVRLDDGLEPKLKGWISRPFGIFHGSPHGPIPTGSTHTYSLVHLPERRILASFHYARSCRVLAAELTIYFARGEQAIASAVVERHVREQV